jgi:hypothetical protein
MFVTRGVAIKELYIGECDEKQCSRRNYCNIRAGFKFYTS